MPEETQSPPPSISPTFGKHKRNWKKILLFLLIGLFLLSLVGIGLYLLIPRFTEEPPSSTQKQVTPPAKVQPKTTKIVWIKDKEIWLKDENTEAKKFFSEEKRILDWDLLGSDKIVYITAIEKSKDEVYGTEIVSLNLKTKKREVLFKKNLNQIISEQKKDDTFTTEDPDISSIAVSPDGKQLAYASSGIWLLDLDTKKTEQIIKTSQFNVSKYCSVIYNQLAWVVDSNVELTTCAYEAVQKSLVDLESSSVVSQYNTGWYSNVLQINYDQKQEMFIKSTFFGYDVAQPRSKIGSGTGEDSYRLDKNYYTSSGYISDRHLAENSQVYFLEVFQSKEDDSNNMVSETINLSVFDLASKETTKIAELGKNTRSLSTRFPFFSCPISSGSTVYYGLSKSNTEFEIYKVNTQTNTKRLLSKIKLDKSTDLLDCFQVTSF